MSLIRAVLHGALGFGVGGFVAGVSGDFMLAAFVATGAFGGVALAFVPGAEQPWPKAAVAGALGSGLGFVIGFFIVLGLWEPPVGGATFIGLVGGGLTGLALGGAAASGRATVLLTLAGAVGFALGFGLLLGPMGTFVEGDCCTRAESVLLGGRMALAGALGGAALGAAWWQGLIRSD